MNLGNEKSISYRKHESNLLDFRHAIYEKIKSVG